MEEKEIRTYQIRGTKKNLDTLEKFLRHAEYLGNIGASRNLLLRVDGDGFGQIQIMKFDGMRIEHIDKEKYSTEQDSSKKYALSGIYDLG